MDTTRNMINDDEIGSEWQSEDIVEEENAEDISLFRQKLHEAQRLAKVLDENMPQSDISLHDIASNNEIESNLLNSSNFLKEMDDAINGIRNWQLRSSEVVDEQPETVAIDDVKETVFQIVKSIEDSIESGIRTITRGEELSSDLDPRIANIEAILDERRRRAPDNSFIHMLLERREVSTECVR